MFGPARFGRNAILTSHNIKLRAPRCAQINIVRFITEIYWYATGRQGIFTK